MRDMLHECDKSSIVDEFIYMPHASTYEHRSQHSTNIETLTWNPKVTIYRQIGTMIISSNRELM